MHYALLQAPRDERVAAFLAVPGFFPHSHDQVSKAYTQLARIWYRDCDVDALAALESELSSWKAAKTHDQELVEVVRIAIKLRKADFDGVLEGFKGLSRDDVPDMYDPALGRAEPRDLRRRRWRRRSRSGTESIVTGNAAGGSVATWSGSFTGSRCPRPIGCISRAALKRP